jgi:hypothetical protein
MIKMFKYYNAHPEKKKVGDCVLRSYCTAIHKDYKETRLELNRAARAMGLTYKNKKFINKYFDGKFERMSFPAIAGCPRMNGERFCEEYPKGTYILYMAHHNSVCIDGVIYDTWDCSEKCVYLAWKVSD